MSREKQYAQSRVAAAVYYTLLILIIVLVFISGIENAVRITLSLVLVTGLLLMIYGLVTYANAEREIKRKSQLDEQHCRWEAEASNEVLRELKGFPMMGIPLWVMIAMVNKGSIVTLSIISLMSVFVMMIYVYQKYRFEKYKYLFCQQGMSDEYKAKVSRNCDSFAYRFFRTFLIVAVLVLCVEIIATSGMDFDLKTDYRFKGFENEEMRESIVDDDVEDKKEQKDYKPNELKAWQKILRKVILIALVAIALFAVIVIIYAMTKRLGKPATLTGDEVLSLDYETGEGIDREHRGFAGGKMRFGKDANERIRKSYYQLVRRSIHQREINENQTHGTSRETLEEIYGVEQKIQSYANLYDQARYGNQNCSKQDADKMERLERESR